MRVLIAGDTHGNLGHVEYLINEAHDHDATHVVQVGDFGYWPHRANPERWSGGMLFHDYVDHLAVAAKQTWMWLDGNHEDHDALDEWMSGVKRFTDSPVPMGRALWYLPRGCRWTMDGARFVALGGAWSIDHATRTPGFSWFPQEQITYRQAQRAMREGPCDVLLTHDMPTEAFDRQYVARGRMVNPGGNENRRMVSEVMQSVEPRILVHGHMHRRYTDEISLHSGARTLIEGLDCDGTDRHSYLILDTADYTQSAR